MSEFVQGRLGMQEFVRGLLKRLHSMQATIIRINTEANALANEYDDVRVSCEAVLKVLSRNGGEA